MNPTINEIIEIAQNNPDSLTIQHLECLQAHWVERNENFIDDLAMITQAYGDQPEGEDFWVFQMNSHITLTRDRTHHEDGMVLVVKEKDFSGNLLCEVYIATGTAEFKFPTGRSNSGLMELDAPLFVPGLWQDEFRQKIDEFKTAARLNIQKEADDRRSTLIKLLRL